MAKASFSDGRYVVSKPERVGELHTFIERINHERGMHRTALVGFDFPIGFPRLYASNAGIHDFPGILPNLGIGAWKDFYEVCRHADEISARRPFYPYNFTPKGTKKRKHLIDGVGLSEFEDLLRQCELSQEQPDIPAAGALFWTLGAKAPGRGAIQGWRDVIAPALKEQRIKLWPFDGILQELLLPGTTVVAETYPTQYHSSIFGTQFVGKGKLENRKAQALPLQTWATKNSVSLSTELHAVIQGGFVDGKDDAFDAVIGLFGMIEVALGLRPEGRHTHSKLSKIEGWILGQPIL